MKMLKKVSTSLILTWLLSSTAFAQSFPYSWEFWIDQPQGTVVGFETNSESNGRNTQMRSTLELIGVRLQQVTLQEKPSGMRFSVPSPEVAHRSDLLGGLGPVKSVNRPDQTRDVLGQKKICKIEEDTYDLTLLGSSDSGMETMIRRTWLTPSVPWNGGKVRIEERWMDGRGKVAAVSETNLVRQETVECDGRMIPCGVFETKAHNNLGGLLGTTIEHRTTAVRGIAVVRLLDKVILSPSDEFPIQKTTKVLVALRSPLKCMNRVYRCRVTIEETTTKAERIQIKTWSSEEVPGGLLRFLTRRWNAKGTLLESSDKRLISIQVGAGKVSPVRSK